MASDQQEPTVVFRSHSRRQCREVCLVLSSANIQFVHRVHGGEHFVVVSTPDVALAASEIDSYLRENEERPQKSLAYRVRPGAVAGVVGYVAVILIADVLKTTRAFGIEWFHVGKTDALAIQSGAWWRAVTALTLHADATHLIGNACVGGLFGWFAGQLFGPGVAWLAILLCGTAGNLVNGLMRDRPHTSIGASTAVFAALGLIAAFVWLRKREIDTILLRRWSPLVGAVVLFGYLGTGGARTDVLAHVFGMICGLVGGIVLGAFHHRLRLDRWQWPAGVAIGVILVGCWTLAIRNA